MASKAKMARETGAFSVELEGALDLGATLYSGQAFRWKEAPDGWHSGFIRNLACRVRLDAGKLVVASEPGLSADDVRHYFRLDPSHATFLREVRPDPRLRRALDRFPGLRLLRQDPWEMLVSFVISQNSNEAKIRATIEALCAQAGTPVDAAPNRFPEPAALAGLSEADLRRTGMGYRARYVTAAAAEVAQGHLRPADLVRMPYEAAFERLMQIDGIGAKVADCVLLYGCDQQRAFPSDVWVRRFVRESYLRRRNPSHERIRALAWEHFGPHAGYAQHYLFHYRRAVGALDERPS